MVSTRVETDFSKVLNSSLLLEHLSEIMLIIFEAAQEQTWHYAMLAC